METTSQLMIFSTDIAEICTNCAVHKALDAHAGVDEWSLDTDDADHILRVVSATLAPADIIGLLGSLGHQCHELS